MTHQIYLTYQIEPLVFKFIWTWKYKRLIWFARDATHLICRVCSKVHRPHQLLHLFFVLLTVTNKEQQPSMLFIFFPLSQRGEIVPGLGESTVQLKFRCMATNINSLLMGSSENKNWITCSPLGGGGLPYISYIGMCHPRGYGFWDVLVWKRV